MQWNDENFVAATIDRKLCITMCVVWCCMHCAYLRRMPEIVSPFFYSYLISVWGDWRDEY